MDGIDFKLIRFNPRRAFRGAPAAEVLVSDGGSEDALLWMNERNLKNNIREFGRHPELVKALEHYKTLREFPEPPAS